MAINLNMKLNIPKKITMPKDPIRIVNWMIAVGIIAYIGYIGLFLYKNLFQSVYLPEAIDSSQVLSNKQSVDKHLLDAVLQADKSRTTSPAITATGNPFAK